ncbi:Receptor-like protein kinase 1 [Quillaja saponaria]|uniref:non-specific serine/threonine protein kinase n=1 Tax=Quillaja saponaria TaxID=32244 RepID=A0AAD7KT40_QUISA|nr:Receptor-like protein kinase 1 [Quillaja saponaria]
MKWDRTAVLSTPKPCRTDAQQGRSNISQGSSLSPRSNSSWLSSNGLYAFGFYQRENGYYVGIFLAGIPQKTVVWTANRDRSPVSSDVTLLFTTDGRLVLQSKQGVETNIVNPSELVTSASILDSGNFVLYNSNGEVLWQSFENPTDTLLQGQHLHAAAELFSSVSETNPATGIFRLKMQTDGHLVQYPVETPDTAEYSYWASDTAGAGPNVILKLDENGHLYLLNEIGLYIKNLTAGYPTREVVYLMRIDADGILRLYSHALDKNPERSTLWSSSGNKCDPKGLCGLNGFCVTYDQEAECKCLPGFAPVHLGNWTSGCERNFTAESCKGENSSVGQNIVPVPNTKWENDPYSVLSLPTEEDCGKACLEDCFCEAALFKEGSCKKQRLPMRYGGRNKKKQGASKRHPSYKCLLLAFAFIILGISGIAIHRYRIRRCKRLSPIDNLGLNEDVGPRLFTYAEVENMTNDFKEAIGRGAFGTVFKGVTLDGQLVVAVKRLEKLIAEGEREFQTEVRIIGQTHHRNLVRLLGFCLDGQHRLLIYEYMSNGSLADVLHTPARQPCWDERIRIARDVARGILYLHEECETQIIHCDIKPQNILMDDYGRARISDFGMAKLLKPDQTKTFTGIRGTKGYVAPEWHRKLPVTVKADVYSFGIVLLEIISCRRNVD